MNSFIEWIATHCPARYNCTTELSDPVTPNNGMKFAATYFVMFTCIPFFVQSDFKNTPNTVYKNSTLSYYRQIRPIEISGCG
ncbi:hypothetical protein VSA01S_10710 [Vibrio sagamiensis NBRC 104589]|uniref:Uncharacterized protein n=1 Tax=Vibrio sagamiensis NBRC 104589 TaxID=1219064 RepID=A0A511QCD6_9VIBR|nr:hypothetical protein VSA01S_10710 [Vibrio sagamiensis NBRC 104589]